MEIIDSVAEIVNYFDNVHALPDEVGRVEVGTYHGTDCGAKLKQRFGIVNAEAGVHFERDFLHSVLCRKFNRLFPIGDKHLIPLVIENIEIFRRPCAGYPVGLLSGRIAAGATGEGYDTLDADLSGKNASSFEVFFKFGCDFLVGVNTVAVHRNCRNSRIILFESTHQFFATFLIVN